MNEQDTATLEASQRLFDAGIVIETDMYYRIWTAATGTQCHEITSYNKDRRDIKGAVTYSPAPSMAEIWRKLPDKHKRYPLKVSKQDGFTNASYPCDYRRFKRFDDTNPTDALIDLLIWVRKEEVLP